MLTQKQVKRQFSYNKKTGILKWKIGIRKGKNVGCLDERGYIQTVINNKKTYIHRLIWLYVYGEFPKKEIDHINRIKDDNRICNLRDVSRQINNYNHGLNKNNKSGYKGVRWNKKCNKWASFIGINNKLIHLSCFKLIKDAIKARKRAELKYW